MHRKSRQNRRPVAVVLSILAALTLVVGAVSLSPATAESGMSPLELARVTQQNCQVLLAKATTSAAKTRARQCIADQQVIIDALSSSPSLAPSATQSPSASPSPTVQPSPTVSPTATTPPATTPPPSPSPTAGLKDCLHQLAACGFPNADNTGPSGTLTVFTGNLSLNNDGQVLKDTEVRGCVEVHGTGVLIRNVRIVGDCFYVVRGFATGLVIEDSELSCNGSNGTAVVDSNFTVRRTDIHNCENGLSVTNNVVLEDSWVHDMEIDNGAHTDGVQINQGATNLTFRHNVMDMATPGSTSAIISWDESSPQQQNVAIDGNLLSGGTYVAYCPREGTSDTRITNNRFGVYEFGYSNACTGTHVSAWSGNVRDGDGVALAAE